MEAHLKYDLIRETSLPRQTRVAVTCRVDSEKRCMAVSTNLLKRGERLSKWITAAVFVPATYEIPHIDRRLRACISTPLPACCIPMSASILLTLVLPTCEWPPLTTANICLFFLTAGKTLKFITILPWGFYTALSKKKIDKIIFPIINIVFSDAVRWNLG